MAQRSDVENLLLLIEAGYPCIAIATSEEARALDVVMTAIPRRRGIVQSWSAATGLTDGIAATGKAVDQTDHPAAALYHVLHANRLPGVLVMFDMLDFLPDARTLRLLRQTIEAMRRESKTVILIDHADRLPPAIAHVAARFELSLPDHDALEQVVRRVARSESASRSVKIRLNKQQLQTMVRNLSGLTLRQAEHVVREAIAEDRALDAEDANRVLASKRQLLQRDGLLDYVEAPVKLSDIAGIRRFKRWLKMRERGFSPEAAEFGIKPPRGVLMLGVPGAGKSYCARAVATAWQRPLLRLDPGVLYDRYIGESERRLRDALRQAEAMSPNVLWIDEIEKGFASAATRSNDGGLSQRMFGNLLTWMQEHEAPVFIFATANNIEALPPELLRKGRFDEIFFVDLPSAKVREEIFRIHLERRRVSPHTVSMKQITEASEGFTGAEIEAAIEAALHEAFDAKRRLTTDDLLHAINQTTPLCRSADQKIEHLRQWASDRCVPAD